MLCLNCLQGCPSAQSAFQHVARCVVGKTVLCVMLPWLQAQDAMDAVEAEIPAYPLEPIRSKRLKEVDSGPERIVKVVTCCLHSCNACQTNHSSAFALKLGHGLPSACTGHCSSAQIP
jgi:hypothetical protein